VVDRVFLGGASATDVRPTVAVLIALVVVRAVLTAAAEWAGESAAASLVHTLRRRLTSALFRLGPVAVRGERAGDLVRRAGDGGRCGARARPVVGGRAGDHGAAARAPARADRATRPRRDLTAGKGAGVDERALPGRAPRAPDAQDVRPRRGARVDHRSRGAAQRRYDDGRPPDRVPDDARPGMGRDRGDGPRRDRGERPADGRRSGVRAGARGAAADPRVLRPVAP